MDFYSSTQGQPGSQHPRSRASSQASLGTSKLSDLNISELPFVQQPTPLATPPLHVALPASHHLSSPPASFPQGWALLNSTELSTEPSTLVPQSLDFQNPPLAAKCDSLSTHDKGIMSTLGIQFDARFDPITRSSYSWPLFDVNEPYLGQEVGSMDSFQDPDAVPSVPLYARSISSSPPQGFSPEQRELKRQRDKVRRDSKTKIRRDRSASNSYVASATATPDLLPRTIDGGFSSPLAPAPLKADSPMPMISQGYIPNPLSTSASPELYGQPYSLAPNDFGNGYMVSYSATNTEPVLIPSYSRAHSQSISSLDQSFYYRAPAPISTPQESPESVRVVLSRPKPQCWEHGCNGRQFSTFSNLLRHQREKSGAASKPTCPKCGAEFTRTTARNGHMAHEKCKQRRNS